MLQLRGLRVDDVMVPRADIDAVDADSSMADLILSFRHAGHSRLPVYEDTMDNIIGFVHIKDALHQLTEEVKPDAEAGRTNVPVKLLQTHLKRRIGAEHMVRTVLFVPPSMPVQDLLQQMQATRLHMAIVVDEYGGTDGLVTIEDLLESVVGDIEDEHDEDDGPLVKKSDEGTFLADARVELTELQDVLGPDFDPGERMEEVDTLGGPAVRPRGPRSGARRSHHPLQGFRIRNPVRRRPPHQAGAHPRQEARQPRQAGDADERNPGGKGLVSAATN